MARMIQNITLTSVASEHQDAMEVTKSDIHNFRAYVAITKKWSTFESKREEDTSRLGDKSMDNSTTSITHYLFPSYTGLLRGTVAVSMCH